MKVGLFFGSFNPIHLGHLEIAEKSAKYVDEVWFIVSPHNPFKDPSMLINQTSRLEMVKLAVESTPHYKVSDVEFNLPTPTRTHVTLEKLIEEHEHEFLLIFGSDCVNTLHTWERGDWILETFPIIAFKRESEDVNPEIYKKLISETHISSTIIRNNIINGLPVDSLLPTLVEQYIYNNGLWSHK
jgi:nicotinate-nucleotide adenylyltransferase